MPLDIPELVHNPVQAALFQYAQLFPSELFSLGQVLAQVHKTSAPGNSYKSMFDRKNMVGHITTSMLVLNEREDAVVLIHHKRHEKWLPPGGHVDSDSRGLASEAVRELAEETGLTHVLPFRGARNHMLLDVDTHAIGAAPDKGEGAHFHHDFLYLCTAPVGATKLDPQYEEVHDARWVSLETLRGTSAPDSRMARVLRKLDAMAK